ncbi:Cysteine/Histidine-rich C1 domain family protein [Euphorbia peplus]|nr:Cysteine/Histidine-rich C1 domain family protein [Euphorbia peplus]
MATRMRQRPCIKHFSHSHPLRPVEVKEEAEIICCGCELDLCGSAYKCTKSKCEFFLHRSCFELPRELNHNSHSHHLLTLVSSPCSEDDNNRYSCNACGDYGTGFAYQCSSCKFNLHIGCALLPKTLKHVDHNHELSLVFSSSSDKGAARFTCDACSKVIPEGFWFYYCPDCDYGTDLLCTIPLC